MLLTSAVYAAMLDCDSSNCEMSQLLLSQSSMILGLREIVKKPMKAADLITPEHDAKFGYVFNRKKCQLKDYKKLIKRSMKFAPNRNTSKKSAFTQNPTDSDNSSAGSSSDGEHQSQSSSEASSSSSSSSSRHRKIKKSKKKYKSVRRRLVTDEQPQVSQQEVNEEANAEDPEIITTKTKKKKNKVNKDDNEGEVQLD